MRGLRQDRKIELLRHVSLFAGATSSELAAIASLTTEISRGDGDRLVRQGEHGEEFFVIVDGHCIVSVTYDGEERDVSRLGPGEFFGELALLDGGVRVATVRADGDVDLMVLNRREFEGLLETTPRVAVTLLRSVAQRLRLFGSPPSPREDAPAPATGY